ncbi:hypothetical protein D8I24_6738 [Cupriavidus necator H850]|nr:hypothetical protein D8I24_6738 [Cupriavidus necator H850]
MLYRSGGDWVPREVVLNGVIAVPERMARTCAHPVGGPARGRHA